MRNLTRRRWAALTFALTALILFAIAAAVFLVDPFEVYRRATRFIPPVESGTQSYSNAGIAKHYEYDSVVIGSSMTENFVPSRLNGLMGGRFVKLCVNGGSPYNHRQMLEMAFRTHEIRTVLYCIDVDALTYFYKQPKFEMPDYLYDENPFNDVRYWFNSSVLTNYVPACLRTWGQSDPALVDTMYSWGDLYPYGAEYALRGVTIKGGKVKQKAAPEPYVLSQQAMLNVEHNYMPFIEAHPETRFVFFFPPYSLVRWYQFYRSRDLDLHLSQAPAVAARLLSCPNAEIYDFRARTEWILDLDRYIDAYHYGPEVNEAMAEEMAAGVGRITDAAQVRQNSLVLADLVRQLREAGRWPSSFDLSSLPAAAD